MRQFTTILTLLAMMALALPAMAQMGSGPRGHMMNRNGQWGGYGQQEYQITPEQQAAYQQLHQKYYEKMTPISEKLWSRRAQLNGALAEDSIDRSKVEGLAKEVGDLMSEYYQMRVKMLMDMREKGLPVYGMGMMHGGMMGGGMMGGYHGGMGWWGNNR